MNSDRRIQLQADVDQAIKDTLDLPEHIGKPIKRIAGALNEVLQEESTTLTVETPIVSSAQVSQLIQDALKNRPALAPEFDMPAKDLNLKIGTIVHYAHYPVDGVVEVCPMIITKVHSNTCVNGTIFADGGVTESRSSVNFEASNADGTFNQNTWHSF